MKNTDRRITAGYYRRYDGHPIYVVDVVQDIDTGEDVVICKHDSYSERDYFVISKKSFCESVNGKKKYTRATNRYRIGSMAVEDLEKDGFRGPIRHNDVEEPKPNYRQQCCNYYDYAKDILNRYSEDLKLYSLCKKERRFVMPGGKTEYTKMKEDLLFVKHIFETVLKEDKAFFAEIFQKKTPIRTYAKEHNLNRGSVVYQKDKLLKKVATLLQARDETDGKTRIKKKPIQ